MERIEHDDRTTLVISGPLRLGEVPELLEHARLAAERGRGVELDLTDSEHLHTAAWQVLFALEKHAQQHGQSFRARGIPEATRALLAFFGRTPWAADSGEVSQ